MHRSWQVTKISKCTAEHSLHSRRQALQPSMATQVTYKPENFSKSKENKKTTKSHSFPNSHSRCILMFFFFFKLTPLFSGLCFSFMAKRCNTMAVLALQPCVYSGKLRAHGSQPRSRHKEPGVYTKVHSLSEQRRRTVKAKEGNGRLALSMLPFGNRLQHTPPLPAHGHHLIQGW